MKHLPALILVAVLVRAMLAPLDWPLAIAFVAAVIAYVHIYATELKLGTSFKKQVEELKTTIVKQDAEYTALVNRVRSLEDASDDVHKLADETKKMVSSANLGMAFRAPTRRTANTTT